jgi:hypothetical protein
MSKAPDKATQFLAAMRKSEVPEPEPTPAPVATEPVAATVHELPSARSAKAKAPPTRAGLKHFGGYLDDDTLEKIVLLRVRLKKDNSQLIKQAIEDLFRKHNAKRAFGDA